MGHNIRACHGINTIQGIGNVSKGGLINRARQNIFYKILSESTRILPALLFIYIARKLGDEDFGKFSFVYSFAGICFIVTDFGLSTILIRNVSRQKELTREYVGNILVLKILLSFICVSAICIFILFTDYPTDVITLLVVFGGVMFFKALIDFFCTVLNAHERMDLEAFLKGTNHILLFVSGITILAVGYGLFGLANVFLVTFSFSSIIGFCIVDVCIEKIRPSFDLKFWRYILRESLPLALTVIFTVIYFKIDVVMLSIIRGSDSEIGWYSAAMRLVELVCIVPALIVSALFPIVSSLYKESIDSLKRVYKTSFRYLLAIALPISVGTFLLSDRLIYIIYGKEYFKTIPALKILTLALIFIFANYIMMNILVAVDRQKTNAIMAGACVLVNIALNMCLIPYYGYLGAGTATVITEIVLLALGLYYVTKYICKINIVAVVSKPLISVAIMGTFIVLATAKLNLAFVIVLCVLTYFTCLLLFRFFTKEDKVILMHLLGKAI
jgi:O-antigen/teichoic acid export membrane protein